LVGEFPTFVHKQSTVGRRGIGTWDKATAHKKVQITIAVKISCCHRPTAVSKIREWGLFKVASGGLIEIKAVPIRSVSRGGFNSPTHDIEIIVSIGINIEEDPAHVLAPGIIRQTNQKLPVAPDFPGLSFGSSIPDQSLAACETGTELGELVGQERLNGVIVVGEFPMNKLSRA
jgi:hypothetical protein